MVLWVFIIQVMRVTSAPFGAALLLFALTAVLAFVRPTLALGVVIPLALVGDDIAMGWWPVMINFSNHDSVLFLTDSATVKPFELLLATIAALWLVNRWLSPVRTPIVFGPFWRPLVLLSFTVAVGMAWGLGRAGGVLRVAVFEATPLLYVPLVYLAATNLFTTLQHYHRLMAGILVALTVESLHTLVRLPEIRSTIADDASPLEHTAALHMNLVLLLLVAALWFGTRRIGWRLLLLLVNIPILLVYLDAERRAAVVGLIIGGISMAFALFSFNRQTFMRVIPVMALIGGAYCAVFWNVENQAGFPAQAVKIIVQPETSPEKDQSSDLYREIENFNLNATIRENPILGIGFGQPFLKPIPLPDISFFEFWEYIPHNSVLWVWTKVGIVGFLAFLYTFALGIARGIRAAAHMRDPDDLALVATIAAFIPMTLVVAFVDITFDGQTLVLLAIALALVGSAERLAGIEDDDPTLTRQAGDQRAPVRLLEQMP